MNSHIQTRILTLVAALLAAPTAIESQQIEQLRPAETFAEPFSNLGGLRWLDNGDMLVSDRTEKAVYRINFGTGGYEMVGHNGPGPQEYDSPSNIFRASGNQSYVVDFGNMRIALMDDWGAIEDTHLMMGDGTFRMPTGSDQHGNLYYSTAGTFTFSSSGGSAAVESRPTEAPVMRWNPETGETSTVASLKVPPPASMRGAGGIRISGGSISGMPAPTPFRPRDDWAVAPDGRIAVVRADDYHIDWIDPNGPGRSGAPVDYEPVPIRQSDKEAWAESRASQPTAMISMSGGSGGGGSRSFTLPAPDIDEVEFPEYFPAFVPRQTVISMEGDLWVQRYESYSADRVLYDVFDGNGNRIQRVALPEGRTLVGFGPGSVFAYWSDDDDLQWLERYEIR